jgi:hypothetical protein
MSPKLSDFERKPTETRTTSGRVPPPLEVCLRQMRACLLSLQTVSGDFVCSSSQRTQDTYNILLLVQLMHNLLIPTAQRSLLLFEDFP